MLYLVALPVKIYWLPFANSTWLRRIMNVLHNGNILLNFYNLNQKSKKMWIYFYLLAGCLTLFLREKNTSITHSFTSQDSINSFEALWISYRNKDFAFIFTFGVHFMNVWIFYPLNNYYIVYTIYKLKTPGRMYRQKKEENFAQYIALEQERISLINFFIHSRLRLASTCRSV